MILPASVNTAKQKNGPSKRGTVFAALHYVAPSISRVLSASRRGRATIYLRVPSPERFAACAARHPMSLAEVGPTRLAASYGVASDRVYSKSTLPWKWVSSYLAFPSLPSQRDGGLFLLPFSGGYPRLTLSAILPCDARTFLTGIPFGLIPRGRPTELPVYYTSFFTKSQE